MHLHNYTCVVLQVARARRVAVAATALYFHMMEQQPCFFFLGSFSALDAASSARSDDDADSRFTGFGLFMCGRLSRRTSIT